MRAMLLALALSGCGAAVVAPTPRAPHWDELASGTTESLRGLSLPDDGSVWASGAHGTVVRSVDGDAFVASVVPGAEGLDLRSLAALDAERAVVLSAGSPARAFVTGDGGAHWVETYFREGEGVFFDSLVLDAGGEGLAVGDPLPSADGAARFALLVTHDAGAHWEPREGPTAAPGEAAFAASNGCLASVEGTRWIATSARVFRSEGQGWLAATVPIASSASAGIFAIAFADRARGYAIGGDYAAPEQPGAFASTRDGGATWTAGGAPRGYRSSIAVARDALVVVGTSGSDVSRDEGAHWTPIDDVPRNVVRVRGEVVMAAGGEGRLSRLSR